MNKSSVDNSRQQHLTNECHLEKGNLGSELAEKFWFRDLSEDGKGLALKEISL